jgi:hypothetical protein
MKIVILALILLAAAGWYLTKNAVHAMHAAAQIAMVAE